MRASALPTRRFCGVVTRLFDVEWQVVLDNVFSPLCDACCFGDHKPTRLQICVSKTRHSFLVKYASSGVKMWLKRFFGFSCHSF